MVVSIILFLLKLIGILLLALFGIFLAAAGIVLLVPLRYEIKGRPKVSVVLHNSTNIGEIRKCIEKIVEKIESLFFNCIHS